MRAVQDTRATVAFDAVGGGTLASELIYAMEQAAASRLIFHSPFGSFERKHVYIYGHLDTSPTVLTHNNYGFASFPVPCAIADYHAAHAGAQGVPSFDRAYSAVAKRFSA